MVVLLIRLFGNFFDRNSSIYPHSFLSPGPRLETSGHALKRTSFALDTKGVRSIIICASEVAKEI